MLCFGFISPGFTSIAVDTAGRSEFAEMPNPSGSFFIRRARRSRSQGASCSQGAPCFLGRRPCGRLLPSTTRRSAWAALRDVEGKGVLQVSSAAKRSLFGERMAFGAVYAVGGVGAVLGGRAGCELVVLVRSVLLGDAHAGVSCRVQLGAPPGRRSAMSRARGCSKLAPLLREAYLAKGWPSALFMRWAGWARCQGAVLDVSWWFWLGVCFWETPMRASPAEYNSALRRGQASLLLVT